MDGRAGVWLTTSALSYLLLLLNKKEAAPRGAAIDRSLCARYFFGGPITNSISGV